MPMPEINKKPPSNTRLIFNALGEDFRQLRQDRGLPTAIGGVATGLMIIPYQIGLAETSISYTAAHAYAGTHNPLATAAAAAGVSLFIESGLTEIVSRSLERIPNAAKTYENIKYEGALPPELIDNGRFARVRNGLSATAFTLTLGSPGMVLRSFARSPKEDISEHKSQGYKAAGALAAANGTLAGLASGGLDKFVSPEVTNEIVSRLESPATYAGLIAIVGGAKLAGYARHRLFDHNQPAE